MSFSTRGPGAPQSINVAASDTSPRRSACASGGRGGLAARFLLAKTWPQGHFAFLAWTLASQAGQVFWGPRPLIFGLGSFAAHLDLCSCGTYGWRRRQQSYSLY